MTNTEKRQYLRGLAPWLGSEQEVSGGDVVQALADEYAGLMGDEPPYTECPQCGSVVINVDMLVNEVQTLEYSRMTESWEEVDSADGSGSRPDPEGVAKCPECEWATKAPGFFRLAGS